MIIRLVKNPVPDTLTAQPDATTTVFYIVLGMLALCLIGFISDFCIEWYNKKKAARKGDASNG